MRALVRSPATGTIAVACGAELAAADVFDEASLRAGLAGCDVAIHLATSLPRPGKPGDFEATDRLRREGAPIWVRACRDAGVGRVIQQSIAMTHAGGSDAWADETTFHPVEKLGAADDPSTRRGVFTHICTAIGSSAPEPGGRMLMPSFRVRNELAKRLLAWSPAYPDFRAGLVR